jgi:hypothetical protein
MLLDEKGYLATMATPMWELGSDLNEKYGLATPGHG